MSEAHSKASKERMLKLSKNERSALGSRLAKQRWANTTPEQKKKFIKKINKARLSKMKEAQVN